MAGSDLLWKKSTVGWQVVGADLMWEKSTAASCQQNKMLENNLQPKFEMAD